MDQNRSSESPVDSGQVSEPAVILEQPLRSRGKRIRDATTLPVVSWRGRLRHNGHFSYWNGPVSSHCGPDERQTFIVTDQLDYNVESWMKLGAPSWNCGRDPGLFLNSPAGGSMFTWTLIIAGAAIVVALVMHFLVPAKGVKIPAVILGTIGGLMIGVCMGFMGAVYYGDEVQKKVYANEYAPSPMPTGGMTTKGQVTGGGGGGSPPPAENKKSVGGTAKGGGGPGSRSMPSGYPAPTEDKTKGKSEESKNESDTSKKNDAP
jgi:hypothetical protein